MQKTKRCAIIANGVASDPETVRYHADQADLLLAANGGASH
jgi:hypothetical protein